VLIGLGLLACGGARQHAALGWSLGGEAHVFVADDRFARDFYRELTGKGGLPDTLMRRSLVAVDPRVVRGATVLSARGVAAARLTLVRFHAPRRCGSPALVTELVLAFPPGGANGRSTPPSHVTVVALLDAPPVEATHVTAPGRPLARSKSLDLVKQIATRAESGGTLLESLTLDADKSADAGEVVPLPQGRYAVGFRARFLVAEDTLLVTGVAVTDARAKAAHWVAKPSRSRLSNGIAVGTTSRYSLRGAVIGEGGLVVLLLDEIADVSARDSRATAVDAETGRVVAAQPLALRCP
jgi:hypothetical protein